MYVCMYVLLAPCLAFYTSSIILDWT